MEYEDHLPCISRLNYKHDFGQNRNKAQRRLILRSFAVFNTHYGIIQTNRTMSWLWNQSPYFLLKYNMQIGFTCTTHTEWGNPLFNLVHIRRLCMTGEELLPLISCWFNFTSCSLRLSFQHPEVTLNPTQGTLCPNNLTLFIFKKYLLLRKLYKIHGQETQISYQNVVLGLLWYHTNLASLTIELWSIHFEKTELQMQMKWLLTDEFTYIYRKSSHVQGIQTSLPKRLYNIL